MCCIAGSSARLGNVVGSCPYLCDLAMAGGRPFFMRYGKYVLISPHHIALADRWFAERGEATAFFSRVLPVVRTFISIPAGIARMYLLRFLVYTFPGSFLWCAALAMGGYYTGANWERLRNVMRPFDYPIAALCGVRPRHFSRAWSTARKRCTVTTRRVNLARQPGCCATGR